MREEKRVKRRKRKMKIEGGILNVIFMMKRLRNIFRELRKIYMYIQSLRQGKARQLCLKTTPLFPKKKRRAASGGTQTRDS